MGDMDKSNVRKKDALDYPYGCAEQTTSKGYAALLLDEGTAKMLGVEGLDATARRKRMEGAFGRLAAMPSPPHHARPFTLAMWGIIAPDLAVVA